MNWIAGFPPSAYVGNVVNELKAEERQMQEQYSEDGFLDAWDGGWLANVRSMIERLEGVADELRRLECN